MIHFSPMEGAQNSRSANLRQKVALLRDYLRQGEEVDMAVAHLREIAVAEAELRGLGAKGAIPGQPPKG